MRIAVVEDESKERENIKILLDRYGREKDVRTEAEYFVDAAEFLFAYKPIYDVVFMDIEMPGMNGMDAAKRLRSIDRDVIVVFITNLKQYALNGYEVEALDFLVKPTSHIAFSTMMSRVLKHTERRGAAEQFVMLSNERNALRVKIADIYYIEIMWHYVVYHTADGEIKFWGSLKNEEKRLPAEMFARCNSCFLVNLAYVSAIDGDTLKVAGDELVISRAKKSAFMKRLAAFTAGGGA